MKSCGKRVSAMGSMVGPLLLLAVGACKGNNDAAGAAPETRFGAFNVQDDPWTPPSGGMVNGHAEITRKALKYLKEHELLPSQLQSDDAQKELLFGTAFADHVYLGRPGQQNQFVPTPVDNSSFYDCEYWGAEKRCLGIPSKKEDFKVYGICDAMLRTSAWTQWIPGDGQPGHTTTSLRFVAAISAPSCDGQLPRNYAFTQDNLSHYTYGDVYDFDFGARLAFDEESAKITRDAKANSDPIATSTLRLYPFDAQGYDEYKWRLTNQSITVGAEFGVARYGAVLYQLARKFFVGGSAEPNIAELIHVGHGPNARWTTGGVQARDPFEMLHFDFPDTYLGGNPYICAGAGPLTTSYGPSYDEDHETYTGSYTSNPCATGRPTWPVWVPETYEPSINRDVWLASLEKPNPGQQDRAARIYLGWAVHMIQDASLPHHAANWVGEEHNMQDGMADIPDYYDGFYSGVQWEESDVKTRPYALSHDREPLTNTIYPWPTPGSQVEATFRIGFAPSSPDSPLPEQSYQWAIDKIAATEIDVLLGPKTSPKSVHEICGAGLGVNDGTGLSNWLPSGELDWSTAYPLFRQQAETAFGNRQAKATEQQVADYIKAAVIGSIKLILCAPPRPADPAVIAALFAGS